ncbi:MAG: NAD-dependent epimerase/dehydratase family protein [Nannocystis sp.]|nr:NAD-dependent epimerase/dehydratase family protein [Nannocystis sp.]
MTVLVTGAAGHVGAAVVRALLEQGRDVRALVRRDDRALAGLTVDRAAGDINDPAALDDALRGVDVVYHTAARISLRTGADPELFRVNVDGTRALIAACQRAGVRRLIHFSSVHALRQEPAEAPLDETRALADRPHDYPYDRSKALAEQLTLDAARAGLDAVIVSPTAVLGPYDFKPSKMGKVLLDLRRGRLPALIAGAQCWVDVRDVAAGALLAERLGRSGERYLLSGHHLTFPELAALAAAVGGFTAPRLVVPLGLVRVAAPLAEALYLRLSRDPVLSRASLAALHGSRDVRHDKAARELGYSPRPLAQTLDDALTWLTAHHA